MRDELKFGGAPFEWRHMDRCFRPGPPSQLAVTMLAHKQQRISCCSERLRAEWKVCTAVIIKESLQAPSGMRH